MALDVSKPTDSQLLINSPTLIRANWDAIVLGTDATLLVTNAKVSTSAAIAESKLLFNASGHGHTGSTDGKQIVLTTAVSGILSTANGGSGSSANANAASGIVVLNGSAVVPLANLGSGTPSSSTFLRGDSSWAAVSQTGFGAWVSKSDNTVYQAATDGFVIVYCATGAVTGYTDASTPPTTTRLITYGESANGFTMPVRKGDYWKVAGATTVYWLSLGS